MERIDSLFERGVPYGIALLRVSLGVMLVAHSVLLKYFVFTLPGTAQFFVSIGLPGRWPTGSSRWKPSAASR